MKTLSILRHGKSSWDQPNLDDIDRPLLLKGVERTKKVCNYMKSKGIKPDFIITSPALRAFDTARIVIEELNLSLLPEINKRFYPGKSESVLDELSELDRDIKHVLIIGHNPVLNDLIHEKAEKIKLDWLPTSGLVTIEFKMNSWEYVLTAKGICKHLVIPKKLKVKK